MFENQSKKTSVLHWKAEDFIFRAAQQIFIFLMFFGFVFLKFRICLVHSKILNLSDFFFKGLFMCACVCIKKNSNFLVRRSSLIYVFRRGCIRRSGNCDHRPNECCFSSSCRCNLWGSNCRCQRMGLFQKWG